MYNWLFFTTFPFLINEREKKVELVSKTGFKQVFFNDLLDFHHIFTVFGLLIFFLH